MKKGVAIIGLMMMMGPSVFAQTDLQPTFG